MLTCCSLTWNTHSSRSSYSYEELHIINSRWRCNRLKLSNSGLIYYENLKIFLYWQSRPCTSLVEYDLYMLNVSFKIYDTECIPLEVWVEEEH